MLFLSEISTFGGSVDKVARVTGPSVHVCFLDVLLS